MSVKTSNIYGNITITEKSIARFVAHNAMDCYGIVEFVSSDLRTTVLEYLKFKSVTRGVKVKTAGNRIFIDVFVIVKYGVSIKAVAESLKEAIKYKTERFSGMIVDTVNVNVMGVKI